MTDIKPNHQPCRAIRRREHDQRRPEAQDVAVRALGINLQTRAKAEAMREQRNIARQLSGYDL